MALCAYHEDTDATSTCVTCKSPICNVCKDYGADGMCGMCLEVANARKTNMNHARAAARGAEASTPEQAPAAGEGDPEAEWPSARRRPTAPPPERSAKGATPAKLGPGKQTTRELPDPRSPSKVPRPPQAAETATRSRSTGKLEAPAPVAQPTAKRLTPKQRRQRRALMAGVAALLVGVAGWLALAGTAEPGEPSEEMVLELRQRMGLVKSAVLSVRERTGALPDSVLLVENELKRREFDPNALSPPLRIVMDRKTSWPYAVVVRTRPKGLELSATDDKGQEVVVNGQPLLMEVPAIIGEGVQAGESPAPTPTPALGDVKMEN